VGKSELVELTLGAEIGGSDMVVLFEGDDEADVWIPKSLIKESWANQDGTTTVRVPEWFAEKEGLI